MGSDNKAKEGDGTHGIDYAKGTKSIPFCGVLNDNVSDYPESRQNQDIDFGMTEKSEKVLVENRVPAT